MTMNHFDVLAIEEASFGARVTGLKLAALTNEAFDALYQTWLKYALLIFPDQHLTREEQVSFARRFGRLESEMDLITNLDEHGKVRQDDDTDDTVKLLKGNLDWHCDSTYKTVQAKGAVFSACVVPKQGGGTAFADMRAAYDALDAATKTLIAPLRAYHSIHYSQGRLGFELKEGEYAAYGRSEVGEPLRPLVKVHPETGRKCLMIGRHAHAIPGMSEIDSEGLLQRLADFAIQPPRVYEHVWQPGDVVAWDNRALMHCARPWDMREPRVMLNSRIAGDAATESSIA